MLYQPFILNYKVKGLLVLSLFFSFFTMLGTGHSVVLQSHFNTELFVSKPIPKFTKTITIDKVLSYSSPNCFFKEFYLSNVNNTVCHQNRLCRTAFENAQLTVLTFTFSNIKYPIIFQSTYPVELFYFI